MNPGTFYVGNECFAPSPAGIGIYTTFLHYKYIGLQIDLAPSPVGEGWGEENTINHLYPPRQLSPLRNVHEIRSPVDILIPPLKKGVRGIFQIKVEQLETQIPFVLSLSKHELEQVKSCTILSEKEMALV